MLTFVTADRFIADAQRSQVVLQGLLHGVSQEEAMAGRDGADGWSVVEVVCHLRDFDGFFRDRVELMLGQDEPALPAYDHEALAIERDYQHQDLRTAMADLLASRRAFLQRIAELTPEQLQRGGIHPQAGRIVVFDALVQVTHHDLTHLDQIARCLGRADRLF
jgi:DinB superfamily